MPTFAAVAKHLTKLTEAAKKRGCFFSTEYSTIRIKGKHNLYIRMQETLNCCGIANILEFASDDWDDDDEMVPPAPATYMAMLLSYAKHCAWNEQRSLIYATISLTEQSSWEPAFKKAGFAEEYKLENRNTGNIIAVYSFNLLDWRI